MLATDGSIFQVRPAAVAYPENRDDVLEIVRFAAARRLTAESTAEQASSRSNFFQRPEALAMMDDLQQALVEAFEAEVHPVGLERSAALLGQDLGSFLRFLPADAVVVFEEPELARSRAETPATATGRCGWWVPPCLPPRVPLADRQRFLIACFNR